MEISQRAEEVLGSDPHAAVPRPLAWVLGFKHSAVWLGAAIGAGYLLVAAAVIAAAGRPTGLSWTTLFGDQATYALYFAGVPVAIAILVRGLERDARDLAPVFSAKEGAALLQREVFSVAPRAVWLGVGVGVLFTVGMLSVFLAVDPSKRLGTLFLTVREITIEVLVFAVMGWAVGAAVGLSRLTEERARPDLLDPRPFVPLARHGARLAAIWLVIQSIGIPFALSFPEGSGQDVARTILFLLLALASLGGIALILPCRGAHRVLRRAKRVELEAVRIQIAEARRTREDAHLPGLLAWETRIEGVSEWPIDAAVLGRTGVFVLLPIASWVASAFVERLVDALLG